MLKEKDQKKTIYIEIYTIVFTIFILVLGVLFEIFVNLGVVLLIIPNLDGISLSVIQIQASLITVTIAVITILSNSISESYMGIAVSYYYLEVRPLILKFKYVIFLEFFLLVVDVGCIFASWYNIVIAVFLVSMVFMISSIFGIYTVFRGKIDTNKEIEQYVANIFKNDDSYKTLSEKYIEQWKLVCINQSTEEFEKYFDTYSILIDRILSNEDSKYLNSLSESLVLSFLNNDSTAVKVKGLDFINEYYEQIWGWIGRNDEKINDTKKQIHLIDRISREWFMVVKALDPDTFNNIISFKHLASIIIRVESCLGYDPDNQFTESKAVYSIARTLGGILLKYKQNYSVVELNRWENIFNGRFDYFVSGIPELAVNHYFQGISMVDFYICQDYLLKGHLDIVKNSVFLNELSNVYVVDNRYYVLKILLIHCFMYYLAFRESKLCIEYELQNRIKSLITDSDVINAFSRFSRCLMDNSDILTRDLEEDLERIIKQSELFPIHSNGKTMIMEDVVREYFLYIALSHRMFIYKKESLLNLLDINVYSSYLYEKKIEGLRRRFNELHDIFTFDLSEGDRQRKTDEMLYLFETIMKGKYKKNEIEKAAKNQIEFENDKVSEKIIAEITQNIKGKYNRWLCCKAPKKKGTVYTKTYKKIQVLKSLDYTKHIYDKEVMDRYSVYAFEGFVRWIIVELENTFQVNKINRNDEFSTDEDFRNYLDKNGYKTLLGSKYVFENDNWEENEKHSEFLDSKICEFIPGIDLGIALTDGINIQINKIIVDVHPTSLEELSIVKDEKGLMQYSPVIDLNLDFEETELQNYIHDVRKTIVIYFDVTIAKKSNSGSDSCIIISKRW